MENEKLFFSNPQKNNANKIKLLIFCKNRLHNITKCQNNGGYLISPLVQEYQKTELQKGSAAHLTFESFYLSLYRIKGVARTSTNI